jgi:hypothetical protein
VLGKLESPRSPGALGPEGVPIPYAPDLATASAAGVRSPVDGIQCLGDEELRQKLGPGQVGPSAGPVTALLNGRVYRGNPRDIPLTAHTQIQLEVGRPLVAPVSITFPAGL